MTHLKSLILEELSFANLNNVHLARRLGVMVSQLKPVLRELEEESKIREVEKEGEKKWELANP